MLPSKKIKVLKKIQAMSEAEFTKTVLIPMFQILGYRVDYHGGPNEKGKDLICSRDGDFDDIEITAVQVKKTKPTAVASDTANSFSEIVTQLQQAAEEPIPLLNGKTQKPNKVYFITPYDIDVRVLESRFAGLQHLSLKNVQVLDGTRVISTLDRKLPSLVDSLCGDEFVIQSDTLLNSCNQDLLSALNYQSEKNIVDFYCDLDFSVGRITSKLFFSLTFSPKDLKLSVSSTRWPLIKGTAERFFAVTGQDVLTPSIIELETEYDGLLKRWESEENQLIQKKIWEKFNELENLFKFILDESGNTIDTTISLHTNVSGFLKPTRELTEEEQRRLNQLSEAHENLSKEYTKWFEKTEIKPETFRRIKSVLRSANNYINHLRDEKVIINSVTASTLSNIIKNFVLMNKLYDELEEILELRAEEPVFEFIINGEQIADVLKEYKNYVTSGAEDLSRGAKSLDEIRQYFRRCHSIFSLVEYILNEKTFSDAAGIDTNQKFAITSNNRIHLPLRDVFATGINCALYGEAGAGKSTTLYQFALNAADSDKSDEITLWIPLTRVLTLDYIEQDIPAVSKLDSAIAKYLSSTGKVLEIDVPPLLRRKRHIIFVFDGVDEVIKRAPWITQAITEFPQYYSNCQVIVSARSTGSYPELTNFMGLSLLPFTPDQVSFFIDGWFKEKPHIAVEVINHLRDVPTLAEIATNPLLATVLCVLADNDVPLPQGELALYEERMKLLLGHYDIHKKTKRISTHHSILMAVARQVAFGLHNNSLRSSQKETLVQIAEKGLKNSGTYLKDEQIAQAVSELISPCNVLVPMTNDGAYGFGHLRYQEYLCAEELNKNRGAEILPLLSSEWWRSVIVLFCRLHGKVDFLVNDVIGKEHSVQKYYKTLIAAIATAPKHDQKRLKLLVDSHRKMDRLDADIREFSDFSDSRDDLNNLGIDFSTRYN